MSAQRLDCAWRQQGTSSGGYVGQQRGPPPGIRYVAADLTAPKTLQKLPPGLDAVFYTAAPNGSDDAAYRAIYVDGLRYLTRGARAAAPITSARHIHLEHCGIRSVRWRMGGRNVAHGTDAFQRLSRAGGRETPAERAISSHGHPLRGHLWSRAYQPDRTRAPGPRHLQRWTTPIHQPHSPR